MWDLRFNPDFSERSYTEARKTRILGELVGEKGVVLAAV